MNSSFARYMEECLYDPIWGYYGSGRVELSGKAHFWTYPQMLSPLFGRWMALRICQILQGWLDQGLLSDSGPVRILEIGAGEGLLARDVLDHMDHLAEEPDWGPLSRRVVYECGEISPALRRRQERTLNRHIERGRARVLPLDGREMKATTPFRGVVLCNELLDAFPCEFLKVLGPEEVARAHVDRSRPGLDGEVGDPVEFVPLSEGWILADGRLGPPPETLTAYLSEIRPLVEDLAQCGLLPVELFWQPGLSSFMEGLGRLLTAKDSLGAALILDYGGTSRHVLDPGAANRHLRVYGQDRRLAHGNDVFAEAGRRDITCDVDFTYLTRLAVRAGLDVKFFRHQSAIEPGPAPGKAEEAVNLNEETLETMATRLSKDLGLAPGVARRVVPYLVKRFRKAPCYWLLGLAPNTVPLALDLPGPEIPVGSEALSALRPGVSLGQLESVLMGAGLPRAVASAIKPCGDLVADLSDHGFQTHLRKVLEILDTHNLTVSVGGNASS